MRVLFIDVNCKQGSTGKIVYDLYSNLVKTGDEAAVCYGRGPRIKEKNVYKFGLDWETYLHAFLTRITGFTGCYSYFSTRRLIKFIKKFRPDVVHIHELHAYYLNIVQLLNFLKSLNVKVIHTLHCTFSYTGKCGHHLECEKWKKCCGNCPRLNDYISTFWFDHTKRLFLNKKKAFENFNDLTIVCPSEWLASYVRQSFLNVYPITVVQNGINTNVFSPKESSYLKKELNISKSNKIILGVAPNIMERMKGGEWILKLAAKFSNSDFVFVMIGVENNSIESIPNNVIALPRTSNQDELARYYSMADMFVICSQIENFPTTCLEAQCCGTPICGFDVGGVKETSVIDEELFVPYGDIESLYALIKKKISIKYSYPISSLAKAKYSDKNMFNQYLSIYNCGRFGNKHE